MKKHHTPLHYYWGLVVGLCISIPYHIYYYNKIEPDAQAGILRMYYTLKAYVIVFPIFFYVGAMLCKMLYRNRPDLIKPPEAKRHTPLHYKWGLAVGLCVAIPYHISYYFIIPPEARGPIMIIFVILKSYGFIFPIFFFTGAIISWLGYKISGVIKL